MARIGPMSEDPGFVTISAPDEYSGKTDAAVRYLPVTLDEVLLGYLWVSVADDAVGFIPRDAAADVSANASVAWVMRLRRSKAEGLTPAEAFRYWAGRPSDTDDHHPTGAVAPGAEERQMESLDALQDLANADGPAPLGSWRTLELEQNVARVAGCLVGGAIGDALGAPVEFDSLEQIRRRYGEDGITGFVPFGSRSGLVTDDTQMTLFTCEGLITAAVANDTGYVSFNSTHRPANPWSDPAPHVYRSYLRWLRTQESSTLPDPAPSWLASQEWLYASRAPGNACTSGLAFGGMGTRDTPKNPDSKGCGTVMRAAPFGLQMSKSSERVFEEAVDASVMTHGHPSGYLAAGALAAIIRAVGEGAHPQTGVRDALLLLRSRPGHEEVTAALTAARDAAAAGPPTPETVESLGGGWTAEEALAIAVYAALCYPEPGQIRDALLLSVNHSGDSDSTGAVCGNILGTWHGLSALPRDLAEAVEGRLAMDQVAVDLAWVDTSRWRYHFPERLADLKASYPAGDEAVPSGAYPGRSDSPVRYLPVHTGELHAGYLWASAADDAASFVCREDEDVRARHTSVAWLRRLRQSKAEGKSPLEALRHWAAQPEDPVAGAVPPDAEMMELPGVGWLRRMAGPELPIMSPQVAEQVSRYLDRVAACLMAGAVGDTLGCPVRSSSLEEIRSAHGPAGVTRLPAPFRETTSGSTQMTTETGRALITSSVIEDIAYGEKGLSDETAKLADPTPHVYQFYRRWLAIPEAESRGVEPKEIAAQPWNYERRAPDDACVTGLSSEGMGTLARPKNPVEKGCGALVRSAPFGLHPQKDLTEIFMEAQAGAVMTHGHPTGRLSAAAFAVMIRYLIDGSSLAEAIGSVLPGLAQCPGHEEVTAALTAAVDASAAGPPSAETVESLGGGRSAEEVLAVAVYAALACPEPEQGRDALLLAVNHSGDSAATGSVCGNLIGAWHGAAVLTDEDKSLFDRREYSIIKRIADDLSLVSTPRWHFWAPPERLYFTIEEYPADPDSPRRATYSL